MTTRRNYRTFPRTRPVQVFTKHSRFVSVPAQRGRGWLAGLPGRERSAMLREGAARAIPSRSGSPGADLSGIKLSKATILPVGCWLHRLSGPTCRLREYPSKVTSGRVGAAECGSMPHAQAASRSTAGVFMIVKTPYRFRYTILRDHGERDAGKRHGRRGNYDKPRKWREFGGRARQAGNSRYLFMLTPTALNGPSRRSRRTGRRRRR
jgi:hypothetical protein